MSVVFASSGKAIKSLGPSLVINAICPFLLYRILQSHFPSNSVKPLLYATIFPIIGLVVGFFRKRSIDTIAIIAMAGIAMHVAVTILARSIGVALIIRSLDGAVIGVALIISALIGRPILFFVAKQIAAGRSSEKAASLNRLIENDGSHAFFTITLVWGICLMAMSGLHLVLAIKLPPAGFLLLSPVIGIATIVALLIWTGWYLAVRMHGAERHR